jgi:hypothetical protein
MVDTKRSEMNEISETLLNTNDIESLMIIDNDSWLKPWELISKRQCNYDFAKLIEVIRMVINVFQFNCLWFVVDKWISFQTFKLTIINIKVKGQLII